MQTLSDLPSSPDRENMRSNCGLSMQYSDLVLINKAWSNLSASLKQLYSLIRMYFISWCDETRHKSESSPTATPSIDKLEKTRI